MSILELNDGTFDIRNNKLNVYESNVVLTQNYGNGGITEISSNMFNIINSNVNISKNNPYLGLNNTWTGKNVFNGDISFININTLINSLNNINLSSGSVNISSNTLKISGSTLNLSGGPVNISGTTINISGGPINIGAANLASISVSGSALLSGATTVSGNATFNNSTTQINSTSVVGLSGGVVNICGGVVNVNGTTNLRGATTLSGLTTTGAININGSAAFANSLSGTGWNISNTGDTILNNASTQISSSNVVGISGGVVNISGGVINIGRGNVLVGTGNVGIGTSAPSAKLEVNGDAIVGEGGGSIYKQAKMTVYNKPGDGSFAICAGGESSKAILYLGTPYDSATSLGAAYKTAIIANGNGSSEGFSTADLHFCLKGAAGSNSYTNTATINDSKMVIKTSGNVGIGTTNPGHKLEVNGNAKIVNDLYIGQSNGGGTLYFGGGAVGDDGYNHSVIETRNYANSESTELLLFKGNDGDDRIRLRAGNIVFDTYTSSTVDRTTENIRMTINSDGKVGIGTTNPGYKLQVNGVYDIQSGTPIVAIGMNHPTDSFEATTIFYGGGGGNGNRSYGYRAVMGIARSFDGDRSINAAGTYNSMGSDYAEYMRKKDNTFTINKGDICGIDASGNLTNLYGDAHSFVVKTTNPSYVGGDNWYDPSDNAPDISNNEAYTAWKVRCEERRVLVDRIAFCGQVPVNIDTTNVKVGDFILPNRKSDGMIEAVSVSKPTFDQYQIAVGKVINILSSTQANIIVKIC